MATGGGDLGVPAGLSQFRQLAEHISDFAYLAGPERLMTWVAPSVQVSLGWDPEDLVGRSFLDLIHPDDVPRMAASREELYRGRRMSEYEQGITMRLRTKSGEYRWFSGRGTPLFDDEGNPIGVAAGLRLVDDLVHERERAQSSEHRVEQILDSMLDPHLVLTAVREDGRIVDLEFTRVNTIACRVLHIARDALLGQRILKWHPSMTTDDLWRQAVVVLETGEPLVWDDYRFPSAVIAAERYYDIRMVRLGDGLSCAFRDVTGRHRAARAVAESESRFRLLAENTTDVVVTVRQDGTIDWVSPAARASLGRSVASLVGTRFDDLIHPDDLPGLRASGEAEVRLGSRVDGWRWMRMTSRRLPDITIYTARDIQAEMQARTRLAHELGHDPLTGLINRTEALAQITDLVRVEPGRTVALLAVGVDDLRSVNEGFTYSAGDEVLIQMASRLQQFAQQPDDVARVGDSEFTVLVREIGSAAQLADLVASIQEDMRSAILIDDHRIEVTVSIGIATAQSPHAAELLRDATSALHHARRRGGNSWEYHDPELTFAARERLIMRTGIRQALQVNEFTPWFQPVVSLAGGVTRGYEALARWDRNGKIISPLEFIPVAESTDLIVALDRSILSQALQKTPAGLDLGVNVSASTLSSASLVDVVRDELDASGFDPAHLNLEVTETTLLRPNGQVKDNMRKVAELGVRWWVDDFGTGYSSITHLRDLPIHGLKLDRSFTSGLPDDATCRRLALGLVGLARGLGLQTIAEGVETAEQAAMLAEQGWDTGQGWYFGRPAPLA